jgi:hypothetical protein
MGALLLLVNAAIIALPVPMSAIIIAFIILAIILAAGSVWLFRSGSRKKGAKAAAGDNSNWQRQAPQQGTPWYQQQGAAGQGGWGQQGQQPGWNAPADANQGWGAPAQQQANQWGAPAQQPSGNQWGAPAQQSAQAQQPAWGSPNNAQANSWNSPAQQQQPAANSWNSPAQQQQPAANSWGTPANQGAQAPWEPAPTPAPAAQDPWNQQPASPWGAPASKPSQSQPQPQTAYGPGNNGSGPSWGQSSNNAQQDPWSNVSSPANQWGGSPAPVNSPAGTPPPWQQQQGGFGQNNSGMDANTMFANNEADKTILRSGPPQQGALGIVRVEEGKEPGRIYEVRKESLSIGRSRESDIFLEDLAVSRLHASIVNMGNGNYALKDEGSANGTKVNGQLVNKYQTYPLQEGDRIQLGQTVLVFARR